MEGCAYAFKGLFRVSEQVVVRGSTLDSKPTEGRGFRLESSEGHGLICILAQRRPPGDPQTDGIVAESLPAFRGSSPAVQGER